MEEINTQTNPPSNSKVYKVIIILLVLAVAALLLNGKLGKKGSGDLVADRSLNQSMLPEGFPKDFPIDVSAQTIQDGLKKNQDGQIWLQFTSNLTVEQAMVVYTSYFSERNWKILAKSDEPVAKVLTAKSPVGDILSINLAPAPQNKTFVTASFAKP